MALYTWPASLKPQKVMWRLRTNAIRSPSMFTGVSQVAVMPGSLWEVNMEFTGHLTRFRREHEAFFLSIRGPADIVWMPAPDRPIPRGTMRGAPTLATQMGVGVKTATIVTTAGATLLAGDFVSIGTYLFMVRVNAVANGAGLMSVEFVNAAKVTRAAGTPVEWDRPHTGFLMDTDFSGMLNTPAGISDGFAVTLIENFGVGA